MDNSDGLLHSVAEVMEISKVDVVLDININCFSEAVISVASSCGVDPRVWALGWGGCQLLCVCKPSVAEVVQNTLARIGVSVAHIGKTREGSGHAFIRIGKNDVPITSSSLLLGEQFHSKSFWKIGISIYIDMMLKSDLNMIVNLE